MRLRVLLSACLVVAATAGACKDKPSSSSSTTTGATTPAPAADWVVVPSGGNLASLVKAEVANAQTAGKKPVVYIAASWCAPCKSIKKYKTDKQMTAAFEGTYIIELDVDDWKAADLAALRYKVNSVPVFIAVDNDGKAKGPSIDGGAWGANIPANMAPPLTAFFKSI
jgi:thiol:disulfide interchange protein